MQKVIAEIKDKLPLVDYLNDYLSARIDERSLPKNVSCPLHKDNKPSLRLYTPKENGGYCFSCGKAFDAISLHKELNGLKFYEAVEELARDLKIEISKERVHFDKKDSRNHALADAVIQNLAFIKQPQLKPKIAVNFDIFARRVHQAVKTGSLKPLGKIVCKRQATTAERTKE